MEFVRLSHKNGNCSPTKHLAVFLFRCYTNSTTMIQATAFFIKKKNAGLENFFTWSANIFNTPRGCKQTTGTLRFRKYKPGKVVDIALHDLHILSSMKFLLTRLRCFCHLTAS